MKTAETRSDRRRPAVWPLWSLSMISADIKAEDPREGEERHEDCDQDREPERYQDDVREYYSFEIHVQFSGGLYFNTSRAKCGRGREGL